MLLPSNMVRRMLDAAPAPLHHQPEIHPSTSLALASAAVRPMLAGGREGEPVRVVLDDRTLLDAYDGDTGQVAHHRRTFPRGVPPRYAWFVAWLERAAERTRAQRAALVPYVRQRRGGAR